ncbi:MAG TPA: mechanosensitive ion channel family protein [Thermoplasmata archaeon]|jgi:small-conductance mechanosensitive channel|nr:MAG TPA: mechanosensitive ion channel family protein [Thermoplasmata archaeon]
MNILVNLGDFINQLFRDNNLSVNALVGESIAAVLLFALSLIIGWIVYHLFEHYFSKWAKKTKTTLDDEIIKNTKRPIYFFVLIVGFYYAIDQLSILKTYQFFIVQIFLVAEVFLVAYIITRIINVLLSWYAERMVKTGKKAVSSNILLVFKKVLHVFVYIFAFLYLLYVSRIDLSGAVVGLGVTGIAIAFALQSILGDAFSAFTIYFDRPFEIGDYVIIGNYEGTITNISMKSTRMKLLQGEELVISNKEITGGSLRNFKKMENRRVAFSIGVTYDTSLEKLKKIPVLVKKIIEKCNDVEFQRVHFKEYGTFSLNFEVVYVMKSPDYIKYLDIQQSINYAIKEVFEKEKIDLAFPTQTILLNQTNTPSKGNQI